MWQFRMKPWDQQIDELVLAGHYADALALLETTDEAVLSDKASLSRPILPSLQT